jgi:hypothetical protein
MEAVNVELGRLNRKQRSQRQKLGHLKARSSAWYQHSHMQCLLVISVSLFTKLAMAGEVQGPVEECQADVFFIAENHQMSSPPEFQTPLPKFP